LNRANGGPDALLGLGFPITSVYDAPTVLENLVSQHQLSETVFALKLNGENGESGELTLGGLNPDAFSGTPIYTPVTSDGFWQIKINSFKVGDSVVAGQTQALVDSVCL
jgi:cathepsin D